MQNGGGRAGDRVEATVADRSSCGGVQAGPALRDRRGRRRSRWRRASVVGQAMAAGSAGSGASEVVQGDGSSDQPLPSQSSTDVPTTARARRGGRAGDPDPTSLVERDGRPRLRLAEGLGGDQLPPRRRQAWPVLSTRRRTSGSGTTPRRIASPACPGPGVGRVGRQEPVAAGDGDGADQLVPSPVLTWSDPSTITQTGPTGAGDGGQDRRGRPARWPAPGSRPTGSDQAAPSHDTVTPDPAVSEASALVGPTAGGHAEGVGDARHRGEAASRRQRGRGAAPPGHRGDRRRARWSGRPTAAGVVGVVGSRVVVVGRRRGAGGRPAGGRRRGASSRSRSGPAPRRRPQPAVASAPPGPPRPDRRARRPSRESPATVPTRLAGGPGGRTGSGPVAATREVEGPEDHPGARLRMEVGALRGHPPAGVGPLGDLVDRHRPEQDRRPGPPRRPTASTAVLPAVGEARARGRAARRSPAPPSTSRGRRRPPRACRPSGRAARRPRA